MTTRRVEITSCYELYDTVVVEKEIEIPDIEPGETVDDYLDRIDEQDDKQWLFEHTGVGHEDGNSYYEMRTIDDREPQFTKEWG